MWSILLYVLGSFLLLAKSNLGGERGFVAYTVWVIIYHLRESGQELKQGLESDTMEECCLLVCSMAHAQLASFIAQEHRTR